MSGRVLLAHGSGGRLSHELVERLFVEHFRNPVLSRLDDAAVLEAASLRRPFLSTPNVDISMSDLKLAFTTDSYVVSPLFFPGGDIGKLAVCGTVNDLAMSGATPLYLSAGFILEEGLELDELERVVVSMAATAKAASVLIVTGDTKVVDHGKADRVFINTAGVGVMPSTMHLGADLVRPGDVVIVSGTIGDHGMTIVSQREGLRFDSPLVSDCAPLHGLVAAMQAAARRHPGSRQDEQAAALRCLRDPTRGGLGTTLCEVAEKAEVGIRIDEGTIPVRSEVRAACELLGLDPLYVANEGKLVAFVAPEAAEAILAAMRDHEYGKNAVVIGRVTEEHARRVVLHTSLGARRIVDMLVGEQLPRIC